MWRLREFIQIIAPNDRNSGYIITFLMSHYFQDKTSVLQVLSAVRKMEPTEIVEWCLKVIWYFLILLGIGGNLALFKEYLYQKNQKLLFNFLILWLAVFDFLYLICLASNIIILAILESMARDDLYTTTGKGLKITYTGRLSYLKDSASKTETENGWVFHPWVCRYQNGQEVKNPTRESSQSSQNSH